MNQYFWNQSRKSTVRRKPFVNTYKYVYLLRVHLEELEMKNFREYRGQFFFFPERNFTPPPSPLASSLPVNSTNVSEKEKKKKKKEPWILTRTIIFKCAMCQGNTSRLTERASNFYRHFSFIILPFILFSTNSYIRNRLWYAQGWVS